MNGDPKDIIISWMNKIWKPVLKAAMVIAIMSATVAAAYLVLRLCGLTDMDKLRNDLGDTIWLYVAIGALQAVQVVFIPVSNQIITVPACLAFPDKLHYVFLASWIGVEIGTIALYFIGRFGGKKMIGWILGDKEKAESCSVWIKKAGWAYPIGMLIPFLPDDVLTTLAGTAKYSFPYVMLVSLVTRGICVAATVWGFGYLTRFWWGWIVLAASGVALLVATAILMKRNKTRP